MKKVLVFVVLFLASCSAVSPAEIAPRLVASAVALENLEGRVFCSGVIVAKNEVLTAAHCDNPDGTFVRVEGAVATRATVLWKDPANDLMVVHVPGLEGPAVSVGKPSELRRGDRVFAVGNPFGDLEFSFVIGYVGYVDRVLGLQPGTKFLQVYMEVRGGNSGGPVFNERGELVGIVTRGDGGGLALVVPVSALKYKLGA